MQNPYTSPPEDPTERRESGLRASFMLSGIAFQVVISFDSMANLMGHGHPIFELIIFAIGLH
jgi:hypothetical protein